jgi:hypothetical protein
MLLIGVAGHQTLAAMVLLYAVLQHEASLTHRD